MNGHHLFLPVPFDKNQLTSPLSKLSRVKNAQTLSIRRTEKLRIRECGRPFLVWKTGKALVSDSLAGTEKALPQLFRTEKSVFIDLVELVQLTDSPEAARVAVSKYLRRLPKACPTPGCGHDLNHIPFLCQQYRYRWHLFKIVGDDLKSTTPAGNALSTQGTCTTLDMIDYQRKRRAGNVEAPGANIARPWRTYSVMVVDSS